MPIEIDGVEFPDDFLETYESALALGESNHAITESIITIFETLNFDQRAALLDRRPSPQNRYWIESPLALLTSNPENIKILARLLSPPNLTPKQQETRLMQLSLALKKVAYRVGGPITVKAFL